MKRILLLTLLSISGYMVSAQTLLLSHKSHSGTMNTFEINGPDLMGEIRDYKEEENQKEKNSPDKTNEVTEHPQQDSSATENKKTSGSEKKERKSKKKAKQEKTGSIIIPVPDTQAPGGPTDGSVAVSKTGSSSNAAMVTGTPGLGMVALSALLICIMAPLVYTLSRISSQPKTA